MIGRGKGLLPRKWQKNGWKKTTGRGSVLLLGGGGGGEEDGDGVAPSVPLVFFPSLILNELIN